jgi:chloramphenicol-sensitive protein RarD
MVVLGVQVLFSFIILSALSKLLVQEVPAENTFYLIIVIIAIVFTVFPLFLNLYALNRINSATIGILMYLNPIFNFSVAFLVFGEQVTLLQVSGYLIIVAALILFNLQKFTRLRTALAKE